MAALNRPNLCSIASVMILAILVSLAWPSVARSAGEDREYARYNGWTLKGFKVTGMPKDLQGRVTKQLALAGRTKLFRATRPAYQTKLLGEDLARIRLFLAREGYPRAVVWPELTPDEKGRELRIEIRVNPGTQVRVGALHLTGWPERLTQPTREDERILAPGDLFRDEGYHTTAEHLLGLLQTGGFVDSMVEPRLQPNPDGTVDLFFQVTAGDYHVIDTMVITGCSPDLLPVATRVANFKPGVEYSPDLLRDMAADLRGTQLFGRVEIETVPTTPGHLELQVGLTNGRMRSWDASVGTWSDNPWMVRTGWTHYNLFSKGVGYYARGILSEHEVSAATGVLWLGWLSPRAKARSGVEYVADDEDGYNSREARVDLVQSFRPSRRDILQLGLAASHVEVEVFYNDPGETPDDSGRLVELWVDWKWDRTNNPIFPVSGQYLKLSLTVAPPLPVAEFPYTSLQGDVAFMQTLWGPVVLTERMRLGIGTPLGEATEVLPNRRFYAGGYNTMRGYHRRRLGPVDSEGNPRGGQVVGLGGVELRFPLFWILEGAGFLDAGQVWRTPEEVAPEDISVAVGVAVDLRTPIGPLRINHAWNVQNQLAGEPDKVWHFGIGYPW